MELPGYEFGVSQDLAGTADRSREKNAMQDIEKAGRSISNSHPVNAVVDRNHSRQLGLQSNRQETLNSPEEIQLCGINHSVALEQIPNQSPAGLVDMLLGLAERGQFNGVMREQVKAIN
jgi:hypothetical protein